MPRKTFVPERVVAMLRQIDVLTGEGKTIWQACKEAQLTCLAGFHPAVDLFPAVKRLFRDADLAD